MLKRFVVLFLVTALLVACGGGPQTTSTPDMGRPVAYSSPEPERVPEPTAPIVVIPAGSPAFGSLKADNIVQEASHDYELQVGESFVIAIDAYGNPQLGVMGGDEARALATATPVPAGRALEQIASGLPSGSVVPLLAGDIGIINDFLDGEAWAASPCEIPIPPGVVFCPTPTCSYVSCEVYSDVVYVMPTGRFKYTDVGARWDLRLEVLITARRVGSHRMGVDMPRAMWLSISSIRLVEGAEVYQRIVRGLRQKQTQSHWRLATAGGRSLTTAEVTTVVVAGVVLFIIIIDGPTPDDIVWLVVLRGLAPATP